MAALARNARYDLVLLALASVLSACGSDSRADPGSPDGGVPSDGSSSSAPPGCDLTKSIAESPQCIDDAVGVFVGPSGRAGGAGTKVDPLPTIAEGIAKAKSSGKPRVYVCEGTYAANVVITDAVSLIGGLSCAWEQTAAKPRIAPSAGTAISIQRVAGPVLLEDFEVVATADEQMPGSSAIAVFVSASSNTLLRNVTVRAGDGSNGRPGEGRANYSAAAADGKGTAAGGGAVTCACLDGTTSSTGGKGGGLGAGGEQGSAVPSVGPDNSGLGGVTCQLGIVGANGAANPGGTGAISALTLASNGVVALDNAKPGANGNPGQGGGGGGGRAGVAGGGGGGCGGCGGAGGTAGGPGGSSVALASLNSSVVIEGGTLSTQKAGDGGAGGDGQSGQIGGAEGVGACDGGAGGIGAGGSGGGGGAGGHSVPIVFMGKEPRIATAVLVPGTAGAAGAGGQAGAGTGNLGAVGSAGVPGKAQSTLNLE